MTNANVKKEKKEKRGNKHRKHKPYIEVNNYKKNEINIGI